MKTKGDTGKGDIGTREGSEMLGLGKRNRERKRNK